VYRKMVIHSLLSYKPKESLEQKILDKVDTPKLTLF